MTEQASPQAAAGPAQATPQGAAGEADVIVVGAGPSGSTTAYYLAQAGLNVLLLEKSRFPREKVCGDGLTPRAVKALVAMGVPISEEDGWLRNKGLRVIGSGMRLELPWPDLTTYPGYGLVRNRMDFDQRLAQRAEQGWGAPDRGRQRDRAGTRRADRPHRRRHRPAGRRRTAGASRRGAEQVYRGRLVIAADGNSSRLSVSMGLRKRDDRPIGVAVRAYYTSPRTDDD